VANPFLSQVIEVQPGGNSEGESRTWNLALGRWKGEEKKGRPRLENTGDFGADGWQQLATKVKRERGVY